MFVAVMISVILTGFVVWGVFLGPLAAAGGGGSARAGSGGRGAP